MTIDRLSLCMFGGLRILSFIMFASLVFLTTIFVPQFLNIVGLGTEEF